MALIECEYCGRSANVRTGARFCSPSCRVRSHQKEKLSVMRGDLEYLARKVEGYEAKGGNSVAEKYLSREEIQEIQKRGQQR
ncbi:hypothetical protein GCM10023189_36500 [Nibrella saemangeumensis]|uniref:Uncharacterized protein n=1 Tax=Nibrella saemangeumensis TaxID=1084526 RepID=A0ABP8N7D1_9BACT